MVRSLDVSTVHRVSARLFAETADLMAGTVRADARDGTRPPSQLRHATVWPQRQPGSAPDVSVVIPTYNRPELISAALETVVAQRGAKVEIVIVNDGGIELPRSVIELFAPRCHALTVVRHFHNRGLSAARNTGASLSSSEWLMMLDDDDVLLPGAIASLIGAAGDADFVFGDHLRQWYDGHDRSSTREYRETFGERLNSLHTENPVICGTFVIRRESFVRLCGYREDLPVHEDYNLHLRVMASLRTAYVAQPICVYHCRTAITRLNHRRLYWFATSALNHAVFRSLFNRRDDRALVVEQRHSQYAHLLRSLEEGCPHSVAAALIEGWWDALATRDLQSEIAVDRAILATVWPALLAQKL